MTGTALGRLVVLLVGVASVTLASMLGLRSWTEIAVATYVIGFGEVVGLVLLLSVFGEFTRAALVVGSIAVLASAAGISLLSDAGSFPEMRRGRLEVLSTSGPLLVLGTTVVLVLSYALALTLSTPPNGWDQLNYHLARAAFWLQSGVGYIDSAYDERLNIYPPNGEIPFSFVLALTRNENQAALAQFVAALTCAVGVVALARRFRLSAAEAYFGALLFLVLPIVLLQSTTTKNDLLVASLLVSASVLVLCDSRRAIGVSGLATALAMGAKFTAGYGVVVLLCFAFAARPNALRGWRIGALACGTLLGSYWYAVNAFEGGGLLGERPSIPGLTAFLEPPENIVSLAGLALDWLDLSGAEGRDLLVYLVAAVVVAAGLVVAGRRSTESDWRTASVAAAITALPLLMWVLATRIGRPALVSLYDSLGSPQAYLAEGATASSPTTSSDTGSWFGPVGLLLVSGTGISAFVLARRRVLERTALVAATAPLLWLLLVASSLTYHPWQGRFFIYPVALSASLWGLVLRRTGLAWGAVALTATTALLTVVHYEEKPSGVRLLDRSPVTSVWSMERWQVQSLHDPALAPVFRFLDEEVSPSDSIALALGANDFGYPAFGPHLDRAVHLVPFGSSGQDVATAWLLANPERASEIDSTCWAVAFESESGTVFRRNAACQT